MEDDLGLLVKLRDFIVDWVQEGFQDFFKTLDDHFNLLSGKKNLANKEQSTMEVIQSDKGLLGLVLVLSQISVFIEQSAIPRITEARSLISLAVKFHTFG